MRQKWQQLFMLDSSYITFFKGNLTFRALNHKLYEEQANNG